MGTEEYYLSQVAGGLDDYYSGAGESSGQWVGGGTGGLGLSAEVYASDLRAVMAGLAPGTGLTPNGVEQRPQRRRVPGFDLTFACPKSVSVLYGLGDPLVQSAVVEAGELAVAEAMSWLEREACFVRRGTNNREARVAGPRAWGTRRMATHGFVAAQFKHRTSRAGDPHLHWHVLVANLAQGVDGRWSALDGSALYRAKRAAGVIFQVVLREALTQRLGVEWGPLHEDLAEIAGVPRRVLREFSQRRAEIEEWLEAHGGEGPAAAAEAMLATRRPKPDLDDERLEDGWRVRANRLGWGPAHLDQLLVAATGQANHGDHTRFTVGVVEIDSDGTLQRTETQVSFEAWLARLVVERLTAHDSTFTRFDVLQAVASGLPSTTDIGEVERVVERVLCCEQLVPLASPTPAIMGAAGRWYRDNRPVRWTSRELLDLEVDFLDRVRAGLGAGRGALPATRIEIAIRSAAASQPELCLGTDQQDAIGRLCGQGNAVEVLVGRAGTGKTTALGALRVAYQDAGFEVWGLAVAARAAAELAAGSGIQSQTIAGFLRPQSRQAGSLGPRTIVVVDEAAMACTRDLAYIVATVSDAGGKVVLVGDHHQLPEIAAGGAFRAALELLGDDTCELTINRRQRHAWEHEALDQLRAGDVHAAWRAYVEHGRVTIHHDANALHEQVIGDWWKHHEVGDDVLLLAGTRAEARRLNQRARARAAHAGELGGPCAWVGDEPFQAGDRIILLHNSVQHRPDGRAAYVKNGMFGTVALVTVAAGTITVRLDHDGREVVLDADYLDAGHLGHGYAVTVYKAQGATRDAVLVVGPDGLNREGSYVALSRARSHAQLYATVAQAHEVEERHVHGIQLPDEREADPEASMLARLERSGAKTLACVADPDAHATAALADGRSAAALPTLARDSNLRADDSSAVYSRAAQLALIRAAHALLAEPPSWLTSWLGSRPTDQAGALVWDDTVTVIAHWRARHEIPAHIPGLGPAPTDPHVAARWQRETLRLVECRCWFNERAPAPIFVAARPARELAVRKAELDALVAAAPRDQRRIVDDLYARRLPSADLQAELGAAARTQTERRHWILEHWPHIVELEQINQLLASRDVLAHWPTRDTRPAHDLLADVARRAPAIGRREERSLADLAQAASDADPLRPLHQRIDELRHQRATLVPGPRATADEHALTADALTAIDIELAQLRARLTRARYGQGARQILDDYTAVPSSRPTRARRARERTVTHDALVDQPRWVHALVEQLALVAQLDGHDLDAADVADLISAIAIYRDRYGVEDDTPLGPVSVEADGHVERQAIEQRMHAFAHRVPILDA